MDKAKNLRNVVIVLALAAAVDFLPGGRRATLTVEATLTAVFAAGFGYFAYRLYREQHMNIYGLGEKFRPLLYAALAVGLVTITAKQRMWQTSFGEFVWFLLMGLVVYSLIAVYRFWRTY
ncbi:MAG TPA: hypothetical protein VID48_07575 [Solirubrobacteraceae bacterium]|jgi:hypothetical protein